MPLGHQSCASVEADFRIRNNQRVFCEPFVGTGVRHDKHFGLQNRRGTKGNVARGFGKGNTDLRFEPLPVSVYKADERDRSLAYEGSQECEIVEPCFWLRIENFIATSCAVIISVCPSLILCLIRVCRWRREGSLVHPEYSWEGSKKPSFFECSGVFFGVLFRGFFPGRYS